MTFVSLASDIPHIASSQLLVYLLSLRLELLIVIRTIVLFLLLFVTTGNVFCQNFEENYTSEAKLITTLNTKIFVKKFTDPDFDHGLSAKGKKLWKEACIERGQYVDDLALSELLITHRTMSKKIDAIVARLVKNNDELKDNYFKIYLMRSSAVNAANLGEGLIFLNLGLLERLKTEDEIAFVIAHEMGHDVAEHVNKSIRDDCAIAVDKGLKRKLKYARKERSAGPIETVTSILAKVTAERLKFRREHELEADRLGVQFFRKAEFDTRASLRVMEVLDSADYFVLYDSIDLKKSIGSTKQPFKPEWLKIEDKPLWTRNDKLYIIPEYAKTHPEIDKRVKELAYELKRSKKVVTPTTFSLSEMAQFETLDGMIHSGEYAMALHRAIQLQKKYPKDTFLLCVVAHSLFEVGRSIEKHYFGDIVDFPDKEYPSSYNKLLTFFHGMSSKRLYKLFMGYYEDHLSKVEKSEYKDMLQVLFEMKKEPDVDITPKVEAFEKKYPKSSIAKFITNFKKVK
jgi:Zn-dependent protease with chaperone function